MTRNKTPENVQPKILFINNFRKRGGGEEFLRDLLPGLVSQGIAVGLVCRPGTPLVDMFRNSAIALHPVQRSGMRSICAVFHTAKIIREGGYAVVNIQRSHDIIQGWLAAMISGTRPALMYTVQVAEFMRSRFLLSRMNRIVTISRHIRDKITASFPSVAGRTSIIYYGIDLSRFNSGTIRHGAIRSRFNLKADTPVIGTVGDLWKNQIEFLDALVRIKKDLPEVKFALVAADTGNEHTAAFKKRAEELGLDGAVLWLGRLTKEDMPSFYADINIAVSTHRNEGFGIWVLEVMTAGKPVVAVNDGGIRDSLEGSPAGMLVDGGPEEMAAAVTSVLSDPVRYAAMAKAGPSWTARRFGRERMVEDYRAFFLGLIEERSSGTIK